MGAERLTLARAVDRQLVEPDRCRVRSEDERGHGRRARQGLERRWRLRVAIEVALDLQSLRSRAVGGVEVDDLAGGQYRVRLGKGLPELRKRRRALTPPDFGSLMTLMRDWLPPNMRCISMWSFS
jgi:hypothetical protein